MRLNGMNIQSAMGHTQATRGEAKLPGVAVSELRALRSVDLVAGPELLEDGLSPKLAERNIADLDRLGPMKSKASDQNAVMRALGRFVRHSNDATAAFASNAADVEKEARLRAVVQQIHNMRTMIRDSKVSRS
jgi:hypothetical protein